MKEERITLSYFPYLYTISYINQTKQNVLSELATRSTVGGPYSDIKGLTMVE